MPINAGELRQRVVIQTPTPARDDHGQVASSYASAGSRWAKIEPLDGRELERARALSADATHAVTIRYWSSVTVRSRIVHRSRTLEVVAVIDILEERDEMRLACKEIV